jgi:hypothetical protein
MVLGVEGEDHGVVEEGLTGHRFRTVPAEAVFENGTTFHFPAWAEQFGETLEADLEKGILGGFDKMEDNPSQIGSGGSLIPGSEVGGDELGRTAQTKTGAWWGSLWAAATTEQVSWPS